jgi:hypothetical protein
LSFANQLPCQRNYEKMGAQAMFCEFAKVVGELWRAMFDAYQPELHYIRGPGPKWHAKH